MHARILGKYTDEYSIAITSDLVAVEDENGSDWNYINSRPNQDMQ